MHWVTGFVLPKYRTTDSRGLRSIGFSGKGFFGLSGNRRAPVEIHCSNTVNERKEEKLGSLKKKRKKEADNVMCAQIFSFSFKSFLHSALMAAVLTGR